MSELPSSDNEPETPPKTPRWVWVFVIIAVVVILVVTVVHLIGGGFHGMHGRTP